jgi:hypothetical protein
MDEVEPALADTPERTGALMRKRGIFAARKNGGHETTLARQRHLTDAIDPRPLRNDAATVDPMSDRVDAEAEDEQLRKRNHAVLAAHKSPNSLMVD